MHSSFPNPFTINWTREIRARRRRRRRRQRTECGWHKTGKPRSFRIRRILGCTGCMHAACVRACVPARGVMAHTKHRINITPATQPRTLARIRPRLRPRLSSKCHEYKFLLSLSLSLFWSIVDSKRNAVVCGPPCRLLRLPIIIIRRWAPPCILDRSISTTTTEIILLLRRHPRPRNPFVRDAYRRQIKFREYPRGISSAFRSEGRGRGIERIDGGKRPTIGNGTEKGKVSGVMGSAVFPEDWKLPGHALFQV